MIALHFILLMAALFCLLRFQHSVRGHLRIRRMAPGILLSKIQWEWAFGAFMAMLILWSVS